MAAIIVGPAMGALVGGAVYYTVSRTIVDRTNALRSELHSCSQTLSSISLQTTTPSSLHIPPAPPNHHLTQPLTPPLTELIKVKWNDIVGNVVRGVENTDWENLGKGVMDSGREVVDLGKGLVDRVRSNNWGVPDGQAQAPRIVVEPKREI